MIVFKKGLDKLKYVWSVMGIFKNYAHTVLNHKNDIYLLEKN